MAVRSSTDLDDRSPRRIGSEHGASNNVTTRRDHDEHTLGRRQPALLIDHAGADWHGLWSLLYAASHVSDAAEPGHAAHRRSRPHVRLARPPRSTRRARVARRATSPPTRSPSTSAPCTSPTQPLTPARSSAGSPTRSWSAPTRSSTLALTPARPPAWPASPQRCSPPEPRSSGPCRDDLRRPRRPSRRRPARRPCPQSSVYGFNSPDHARNVIGAHYDTLSALRAHTGAPHRPATAPAIDRIEADVATPTPSMLAPSHSSDRSEL